MTTGKATRCACRGDSCEADFYGLKPSAAPSWHLLQSRIASGRHAKKLT